MYDVIIIGSGPAGLSAAIYAKRAQMNMVLLEKESFPGGQIIVTDEVDNYLGIPEIGGYDLAMRFMEHCKKMDVPIVDKTVERIEDMQNGKKIFLSDGSVLETKTIVISMGARHRKLGIDKEKELTGAGVSYCATCDGAFFREKEVAVVGGGDVALGDALYLSKICKKVYLITRRDTLRASKKQQKSVLEKENIVHMPFYEVEGILGEKSVEGLVLRNNQNEAIEEIRVSGIFVAIGMEPQSELVRGMVDLDKGGYIIAGEDGQTSDKAIFAAGDIRTKPLRQIVTAVADGANVIHTIESIL